MVRFWGVMALAVVVGTGCGDSASQSQSHSSVQSGQKENPPDEPLGEAGLYAKAQASEQEGRPEEAIALYRRIFSDYPQSPNNYKAVFLIGFVFSEKLNQPDSARLMFHAVIRDYPGCEFVDDAQAMLRFLDGELPPFEDTPHS